jgi:hypothetical protein
MPIVGGDDRRTVQSPGSAVGVVVVGDNRRRTVMLVQMSAESGEEPSGRPKGAPVKGPELETMFDQRGAEEIEPALQVSLRQRGAWGLQVHLLISPIGLEMLIG